MQTTQPEAQPIVWMNVTTSANWNRPPVGIVRVEQALCKELAQIFEGRFKRCVWIDDTFVEWFEQPDGEHRNDEDIVDVMLPRIPTFDMARRFLTGRLSRVGSTLDGHTRKALGANKNRMTPGAGDILITVGLDWDQPYASELYRLKRKAGIKIITCCYDLIPILFPQFCVGDVAARFKDYFDRVNWGSSAVLCISKQSQHDILQLWDQTGAEHRKTLVIPLGDNVLEKTGKLSDPVTEIIAEPFILFVSTIERRKNHEVLYRAYHLLARAGHRDLPKLVFVGMAGWGVGDLLKDIDLDPVTQDLIIQLNHVNDLELIELYKKSLFCVYPSLYEGWGLPVGEALSLGKAVLSSDQGSLPEVGGNLVKYLAPWEPQAWADAMLEWITEPQKLAKASHKVKTEYKTRKWSDTAKVVAELITELTEEPFTPIEVLPGYECSTQCGLHIGPVLRSVGQAGFLMFGPHIGMAPGNYRITFYLELLKGSKVGSLLTDAVAHHGTTSLAKRKTNIKNHMNPNDEKEFEINLNVNLDEYIEDFEVRLKVNKDTLVDITLVKIEKI